MTNDREMIRKNNTLGGRVRCSVLKKHLPSGNKIIETFPHILTSNHLGGVISVGRGEKTHRRLTHNITLFVSVSVSEANLLTPKQCICVKDKGPSEQFFDSAHQSPCTHYVSAKNMRDVKAVVDPSVYNISGTNKDIAFFQRTGL